MERKRKQSSGKLTTTRQAYMGDQVDADELDVLDDNDDDDDEFSADRDGPLTHGANGHNAVKPRLLLDWRTSSLAEVSADELLQLSKAVSAALGRKTTPASGERSRTQEQLVQSAPYASILGVVLLGVGMMAYLNGWQKGVVDR